MVTVYANVRSMMSCGYGKEPQLMHDVLEWISEGFVFFWCRC